MQVLHVTALHCSIDFRGAERAASFCISITKPQSCTHFCASFLIYGAALYHMAVPQQTGTKDPKMSSVVERACSSGSIMPVSPSARMAMQYDKNNNSVVTERLTSQFQVSVPALQPALAL